MKAIQITKPGGPEVLEWRELVTPVPGENDVLIKVVAAGVNRPDIMQRKGSYPPPPGAPPDIPGLEVAGIIQSCGNVVTRWKKGDHVCALLAGGGYAEYVVVAEGQCLPLPHGWDHAQAASLPETVFTVWHNVFQRGGLKPGENFLVHGGSSGIGITAIQLAKAFGAKVYTTAGSKEKCSACMELGATICVNYKESDFETILQNIGIDVILDMVGGDYISKNINLLRPDGRLVFINAMAGNELRTEVWKIMQKRLTITGSTLRPRDIAFKSALAREIEEKVWPVLENGKFKPVIYQSFPMKEAAKAHALMESGTHIGKIVLINENTDLFYV
jgi:NADPH2:quinone reductase